VLDEKSAGGRGIGYRELFNESFSNAKVEIRRKKEICHQSSRIRTLAPRDPDFSSGSALRRAKIINFCPLGFVQPNDAFAHVLQNAVTLAQGGAQ